jgi:uncharacterized protein DUF1841
MFAPSRDQARTFLFDTWGKYQRAEALAGLEQTALSVILMHPEYHAMLGDPERYLDRDFGPQDGGLNPFLHLSLHLAVAEQLQIDQPPGILERFRRLAQATGSEHDALHAVVECLGETVWQAQRLGTQPDQQFYLECLDRRAGR